MLHQSTTKYSVDAAKERAYQVQLGSLLWSLLVVECTAGVRYITFLRS
jgi:hypothetical protein